MRESFESVNEIIGTFTMFNQGQMETSLTDGYNYNAISSPLLPLICKIKQGGGNHQTAPAQVQNIIYRSQKLRDSQFNFSCCLVSSPKPRQIKARHRTKFRASSRTRTLPCAVHRGARASVRTASRVGLTELGQAIVKKQCLQTHV